MGAPTPADVRRGWRTLPNALNGKGSMDWPVAARSTCTSPLHRRKRSGVRQHKGHGEWLVSCDDTSAADVLQNTHAGRCVS